ncbi:MAG: hypothetical protein K0S55_2056 [Clostridia bacterium]|nr:hypothetical protein [Clostridia bacterium]
MFTQISLSKIMFAISICALITCFTMKNNNFLDVKMIFKQHFQIFENAPLQKIIFIFVPLLMAIGIIDIQCVDKDIINNLNIVISIFMSMFFAMLSVLSGMSVKDGNPNYNKLLKETYNTIIFEMVLCIIILMVSFVLLFMNDFTKSWFLNLISFLIYYLLLTVLLNIFIVIKRVKFLFDNR